MLQQTSLPDEDNCQTYYFILKLIAEKKCLDKQNNIFNCNGTLESPYPYLQILSEGPMKTRRKTSYTVKLKKQVKEKMKQITKKHNNDLLIIKPIKFCFSTIADNSSKN